MARTPKRGIDYFSHDVDSMQDTKMKYIKAKHGLIGYGVYFRLLEEIYRENGYYLDCSGHFMVLFADENNINIDDLNIIIGDLLDIGLFDKNQFESNNVLTSCRILLNYLQATERRAEIEIIENYVVDINRLNVYINRDNVNINRLNVNNGTQSKVKESKGKDNSAARTIPYKKIVSFLNSICGSNYKDSAKATRALIKARYNEGFTYDDFEQVISSKAKEWLNNPDMVEYLRPQTLFGTKFESYLQASYKTQKTGKRKETCAYNQGQVCNNIRNKGDDYCDKCNAYVNKDDHR